MCCRRVASLARLACANNQGAGGGGATHLLLGKRLLAHARVELVAPAQAAALAVAPVAERLPPAARREARDVVGGGERERARRCAGLEPRAAARRRCQKKINAHLRYDGPRLGAVPRDQVEQQLVLLLVVCCACVCVCVRVRARCEEPKTRLPRRR